MTKPCPGPASPGPTKIRPPAGTTDTHAHILGPYAKFPLAEDRSYTAPESTVDDYRALMATLGIDRVVIVHGSAHGPTNDVTADAISQLGDCARGIAVVPLDVEDDELDRLHAAGFRGVRLTTLLRGGTGVEGIRILSERVARLGWHVQVFVDGPTQMLDIAPALRGLPTPLVIDHMGRFRAPDTVQHPGFQALLKLFEEEDCWVKLSAPNRLTEIGPPFADVTPFANEFINRRPDRCVWATDWPHVMVWNHPMPEDADLLDWCLTWSADEATRKAILVDNPAVLYGF